MNFLTRDLINERLRLRKRTSFRIVGSSRSGLISSDALLALLNRARRNMDEPLDYCPTDLKRPEELCAAIPGLKLSRLRSWTRRKRNGAPHFRLNSHTLRYSFAAFTAWLARLSIPERWS